MRDEEAPAVGGNVLGLGADVDAAEGKAEEVAHRLVVVAGDVGDARALARLAQHLLHHVVVRLVPVPAALQLPAVDDVADEVEVRAVGVAQEVEEPVRLAARGAEVDVRDEDRAVAQCRRFVFQLIRFLSIHAQAIVAARQVKSVAAP